jgi:hypothetical protein
MYHRGMRVQHSLNFSWVDILSKANDQFLGSSNDKQISVFEASKIAGIEPSFSLIAAAPTSTYLRRETSWKVKSYGACRRRLLEDRAAPNESGLADESVRSNFVSA